jgi:hypothetical protein
MDLSVGKEKSMETPPPADSPPPARRRFDPRRRDSADEVIHWLRLLGGRFQSGSASRGVDAEAVRGTTTPRTRNAGDS